MLRHGEKVIGKNMALESPAQKHRAVLVHPLVEAVEAEAVVEAVVVAVLPPT